MGRLGWAAPGTVRLAPAYGGSKSLQPRNIEDRTAVFRVFEPLFRPYPLHGTLMNIRKLKQQVCTAKPTLSQIYLLNRIERFKANAVEELLSIYRNVDGLGDHKTIQPFLDYLETNIRELTDE